MPLPLIIAGIAAVTASAVGAKGHFSAKKTNEMAQQLAYDAKVLYEEAEKSLQNAKTKTENSLLKLGTSKQEVLEGSINNFVNVYNRLKNIQLSNSTGINELDKFSFDSKDEIELQKMTNIYKSSLVSGAAGAAAGVALSLAASGSLSIVTGTLSIAGSLATAGEIGMAAGVAGSALSLTASVTPLAVIAAPVVLFTGISAKHKAEENYEKSSTMYAQSEAAVEKMKISETLCKAITDRSKMYNDLLNNLNDMFTECVVILDSVTKKKQGLFGKKTIKSSDLTQEEINLFAVTRALAGAVKSIIDIPILSEDGTLSDEGFAKYNKANNNLSQFEQEYREVKTCDYGLKALPQKVKIEEKNRTEKTNKTKSSNGLVNCLAFASVSLIAFFAVDLIYDNVSLWMIISSSLLLLLLKKVDNKFIKFFRGIAFISFVCGFSLVLYNNCSSTIISDNFILKNISVLISSLSLIALFERKNTILKLISRFGGATLFYSLALFIAYLLNQIIGLNYDLVIIICEVLFIPFAALGAYFPDA